MPANAAGEPISVTHSRLPFNRNSTGCLLTISTFFCQAFVSECLAVTMTGVHCDSDWLWHSQVFISDSDRYLLVTGTWRRQCDSCLPVTCAWLSFIDICVCVKCLSDRCLCWFGHSATMLDMFVSDMSGHTFACQACLSMSDRQWAQRDVKDGETLSGDTSYEITLTTAHRCCSVCRFVQEKCLFLWWNFERFWWKMTASAFHSAFEGRAFWRELSFLWQLLSWMKFPFLWLRTSE